MESLHANSGAHSDHEPTPNPSQEGNGQDADERLLPSWEGSGVGRFMEREQLMAQSRRQPMNGRDPVPGSANRCLAFVRAFITSGFGLRPTGADSLFPPDQRERLFQSEHTERSQQAVMPDRAPVAQVPEREHVQPRSGKKTIA